MRLTTDQKQEVRSYYKNLPGRSMQASALNNLPPQVQAQQPVEQPAQQTAVEMPQEDGSFSEKLQDYGAIAGNILTSVVPGRELATGLGYTLAAPFVEKRAEASKAQDEQLYNTMMDKYRDARKKGDKKRMEQLKKVMGNYETVNVMKEVYDEAPTNRQVVFSAVELAALAALAYKPYLPKGFLSPSKAKAIKTTYKAVKAANQAAKLKKLGTAGKVVEKLIKPVVKQSAIGAGMFGITKARERDATVDDIVKAAGTGALISGGITVGSIAIGEGLGYAGRKLGPKISAKYQKTVRGLERTAAGPQPIIEKVDDITEYKLSTKVSALQKGTTQVDETLKFVGDKSTFKQKAAKTALKFESGLGKLKTRFIDAKAPFQKFEKRTLATKGKPLSEAEKVFRDSRILTSVSDQSTTYKVKDLFDDLMKTDLIDDVGKINTDLERKATAWMVQTDLIDRAKLGQTVAGGQSMDDLMVGMQRMSQEIGPDDMKKVTEIKNVVNQFNVNYLDERVTSGLITPELRDLLLETHPNYIPHNVLLEMDDVAVKGLSDSFDVPKTDVIKAVGSVKNIKDPVEATIANARIAERVIQKNKLLNNLVTAQETYNIYPGMKQIEKGVSVADDFGKINLFRDGIKESWQVPKDLAYAVKKLDTPISPGWWKIATAPQKVLKKGATQYNISFSLPNKFRDKQTAALTSHAFIESMAEKTGVKPKDISNMTVKEINKLYDVSGGYGSSIFAEGDSIILKDLQKSGMSKNIKSANPFKIIESLNNGLERSTRIEVFKSGMARGLSSKDAAFIAREATVDFAKMGTWMRPANQAIPFLNARVQGFVNLPKAFVANPEVFARMQMYTAVYPTMLLHQHNRRFDSYSNVSQYIKNKYWVLMTGETDGVDNYSGNPIKVPQFITVPKGEGQTLVASPIQYYLEKSDGVDYRSTGEMLADTLGSTSPLEFQTWGGGNIWLTLAGQAGPAVSIPVGLAANKTPYSGTAIVPENRKDAEPYMQYASYTPEVTKELSKALKDIPYLNSPAQLSFILGSFGGVPQDAQNAIDIAYNVVRDGNIGGNSISDTPWGSLTQIPLSRRFFRESAEKSSKKEYQQKQKQEIKTEVDTAKLKVYDAAEDIWQTMNRKKTEQEKVSYLASLGDTLTPEVAERIFYLKGTRGKTFEVLRPTDPIGVRAKYIVERLEEMEQADASQEEILKYIGELKASGLLTESVSEMILQLRTNESL